MDRFEESCALLNQAFQEVTRWLGRELADRLAAEGVTPAQFFLMHQIGENDSLTVSDAARMMGVTLSAVTLLADRLHAAGWLARHRDEQDRRIVRMTLTETGVAKLAQLESRRTDLMRQCLACLSQEDMERLLEIFTRLAAGTGVCSC
ncbi:MAG: MarR family transcriptional regulator [Bacillota bacterium]